MSSFSNKSAELLNGELQSMLRVECYVLKYHMLGSYLNWEIGFLEEYIHGLNSFYLIQLMNCSKSFLGNCVMQRSTRWLGNFGYDA